MQLKSSIHTALTEEEQQYSQCFCKGAGREDESALGMRLQRYTCLIRGCDSSDPDGGKAVAPAGGSPTFLGDLVTAESGGEFF